MKAMMARLLPRVKEQLFWLVLRLAPPGSRRQLLRYRLGRFLRRLRLPRRLRKVPPLPDFNDSAAVVSYVAHFGLLFAPNSNSSSDRIWFWIDFHPYVLDVFPLAATPAERGEFIAWLLTNLRRFELEVNDIVAFGRELADDSSYGIESLYRRNAEWQRVVPNGLLAAGWDKLRQWLARRYRIVGSWITTARCPAAEVVDDEPGVNLLAHFCYPSGLQVAARNTFEALKSAGWCVSGRDVPNRETTDRPERRHWLGLHPHPITLAQVAPMPLGRNAYFLAGLAERPETYRIGYWYWELESVPPAWAAQSNWISELWAPTRFIGDAFRRVMPQPVYNMLPGMTMPPRIELPRLRFGLPDNRFLFLFAFDMSSVRVRKNPEGAISAFRKAFGPGDPVSLVIKISRGWQDSTGLAALHACSEPGRILILDEVMPISDVFGLMNCCDAYVSLHRSEGFGLTLAEAMALGKPTIATRYSGNLDFMNDRNSLLVDFELRAIDKTAKVYARGGHWGEPSIDDAARKMRWVVDHPNEAKEMADRGCESVREVLSLEAAGRRMAERLAKVADMVRFQRSGFPT